MPENPSLSADERAELEAASGERGPARSGAPAARQRWRTVVAALLIMVACVLAPRGGPFIDLVEHTDDSQAPRCRLTSDRRRWCTTLGDSIAGGLGGALRDRRGSRSW